MLSTRRTATRGIALMAVGALTLSGCGSETDTADDSELAIGLNVADHTSWDPTELQGGPPSVFWTSVYDTVLHRAPDGSIAPGAAEDWSYNEDNTELTLTLREGMTFHDGTEVTSEAAATTMEAMRDSGGPDAAFLGAVEEFETPDDHTLILQLDEPDPALLEYLTNTAGVIAHPDQVGTEEIAGEPAGSGPYELDPEGTTVGSEYSFTRNDDYWDADNYPYETVVVRTMTDNTARLNALRNEEIDAANLEATTVDEVQSEGFDTDSQPLDWAGFFIVDREGEQEPALGDVRVRQAINLVFERDAMVANLLMGHGAPTSQIFQEGSEAHVPGLEDNYEHDLERAQELMDEAGYGDGFDITLPSSFLTEVYEPTIAAQLEEIGIRVSFENVPDDQIIPELLSGEYPMFWFQHESQFSWYDLSRQVAPDAVWNTLDAEDEELNELMEQAQYATDEDEADEAYQEIGTWLVENAWFAPVLRPEQVTVTQPETDVEIQNGFSDPFVRNYQPAD